MDGLSALSNLCSHSASARSITSGSIRLLLRPATVAPVMQQLFLCSSDFFLWCLSLKVSAEDGLQWLIASAGRSICTHVVCSQKIRIDSVTCGSSVRRTIPIVPVRFSTFLLSPISRAENIKNLICDLECSVLCNTPEQDEALIRDQNPTSTCSLQCGMHWSRWFGLMWTAKGWSGCTN